jgi:membrane protein DedA with SNARE-associated domain
MHALLTLWFGWVRDWGYAGIVILMAMESSIFPVPSEVVVPPAAFWAAQGKMNYWGVIAAGTFGSWLGSAITYLVSRSIGRALIVRYGKYCFIREEKLARAEAYLQRYEVGGVFFARLLPVIRHLISIPAGIVRMNFAVFSAVTITGSFIWCWVLAYMGAKAYHIEPRLIEDPERMVHFVKGQSLWIVLGICIFAALYVLVKKLTTPKPVVA